MGRIWDRWLNLFLYGKMAVCSVSRKEGCLNEDSVYTNATLNIYAVADGISMYTEAAEASRLVIKSVEEFAVQTAKNKKKWRIFDYYALYDMIYRARNDFFRLCPKASSSLVFAMIDFHKEKVDIAWLGDSLAYILYENNELLLLNENSTEEEIKFISADYHVIKSTCYQLTGKEKYLLLFTASVAKYINFAEIGEKLGLATSVYEVNQILLESVSAGIKLKTMNGRWEEKLDEFSVITIRI